jgi:hypothetical protein
MKQGKISSDF